ncbi:TPA: hypothetical protein N0F65_006323 [Lagenidium giganteum]|uniref:Homeobox domain-containing protein n=1 Tax=Lagenidium giganteum TaxID=4803 RepID=A0AAV2YPL7_9STRA|nr:TPA: hypothetical protein N0F65_006323 [Lagenidium giganteum]
MKRAELQAVQQLLDRPEDILAKREADRENQPPNGDQLHVMTIKILFYYVRLWNYTCIVCMDAVRKTQLLMAQLQMHPAHILSATKRRAASISPALEDKSADALSHSMVLSSTSSSKRPRLTRSVNEFLVAWFLAHKANPYPSANERAQIAARTDLSEQQVRNWFANMRKRHWKPSHQSKKPRSLLDVVLRKTDA